MKTTSQEITQRRLQGQPTTGRKTPYTLIDLFAGAGGLTLGFDPRLGHNFKSVWANDSSELAAETYSANFGTHCVAGDILEILASGVEIPRADVVIGGPPCQGFSLLNKNRENDPRKTLWRPFMEIVERSGARVFLIENVPQILASEEHREIVGYAEQIGFVTHSEKLCAADYGVPQTRSRAFILGSRVGDPREFFPPMRRFYNARNGFQTSSTLFQSQYVDHPETWRTVRDAIRDLPLKPVGTEVRDEPAPLNLHFGRNPTAKSLARYQAIPDEGMNRFDLQQLAPHLTPSCWIRKKSGGTDLFGRLWWDRPAVTIRTEFYKPEKGRYLHPSEHRPITMREAARFQSFPDWFEFKGTKIEIAKQIGNAVPPVLAAHVADCITALLESCRR